MELLDIDYEILNFIDQFEKVTESNILKKFPNDKYATKFETEFVFVTPLGRMALQNQSVQKCTKSKALREFRFCKIVPILISAIALLVAILAYNKSQSTEQYVKIEISKEAIETISGNQSSNGNSSKN